MLANVSGNFLIENCEFINSVYSVANGPTGGSAGEAQQLLLQPLPTIRLS